MKTYSYSTSSLQSFIIVLFEKYAKLLEKQFTSRFETVSHIHVQVNHYSLFYQIVREDEHTPMKMDAEHPIDVILDTVWVSDEEKNEIQQ